MIMDVFFHDVRCSFNCVYTSDAFDEISNFAKEFPIKGINIIESNDQYRYELKFGRVKVVSSSPISAYKLLKKTICRVFNDVEFHTYSIANGTVEFSVHDHLESKLEEGA